MFPKHTAVVFVEEVVQGYVWGLDDEVRVVGSLGLG